MIDILSAILCWISFVLWVMLSLTCITVIGCVVIGMTREIYENRKE